jgi:hypothetical protein
MNYTNGDAQYFHYYAFPNPVHRKISQEHVLSTFFFITSDDNNTAYTNATGVGWIYPFSLKWLPDFELTLVVNQVLNIFAPLLIITVPSLILGKLTNKKYLSIFFIVMAIIVFIADVIPMWLLFIIALMLGTQLFTRRDRFADV